MECVTYVQTQQALKKQDQDLHDIEQSIERLKHEIANVSFDAAYLPAKERDPITGKEIEFTEDGETYGRLHIYAVNKKRAYLENKLDNLEQQKARIQIAKREEREREKKQREQNRLGLYPQQQFKALLNGDFDNYKLEAVLRVCDPHASSNQVYYHDEKVDIKAGISYMVKTIKEQTKQIEELKQQLAQYQIMQHN